MRYKLFGRSGLRVSEICLGAMTFGEAWNWGASQQETAGIVDLFLERGGNFIDTANAYTNGESESFLGEILQGRRQEVVLASKYTLAMQPENPNAAGNHRKNLVESLDASLKRLRSDYLDVYWVHAWDAFTPVEETMRALDDQVRAGKVLYVGISDAPAWWVARANTLAEWKDWSPFLGLQLQYSLIERTIEREFLPLAKALDLAVCAWSPLAGGALTGKYLDKQKDEGRGARYDVSELSGLLKVHEERNVAIVQTLVELAEAEGRKPHQLALNWLRNGERGVPVIPIVGARSQDQLKDSLEILDFELSAETLAKLDEVSQIDLGFPHDFLESVAGVVYGEKREAIDNHRT